MSHALLMALNVRLLSAPEMSMKQPTANSLEVRESSILRTMVARFGSPNDVNGRNVLGFYSISGAEGAKKLEHDSFFLVVFDL